VQQVITLTPTCGSVGATVQVTGSGWAPGTDVTIRFDPQGSPPATVTVPGKSIGPNGTFTASLTVPSRPDRGTPYLVQATQTGLAVLTSSASFSIPCPRLTLDPDCGSVRSPIAIHGAGFRQDITVTIAFTPPTQGTPDATAVPASNSDFDVVVRVPDRPPGVYVVVATQAAPAGVVALPPLVVRAQFQIPCVKASIVLRPKIGPPGTVTTVVGTGFPVGAVVKLSWSQGIPIRVASITIGATQGFQMTLLIYPHDALGQRTLRAGPDLSVASAPIFNIATADFLVVPGTEQPRDFSWRH
jgi:hypothetical protein